VEGGVRVEGRGGRTDDKKFNRRGQRRHRWGMIHTPSTSFCSVGPPRFKSSTPTLGLVEIGGGSVEASSTIILFLEILCILCCLLLNERDGCDPKLFTNSNKHATRRINWAFMRRWGSWGVQLCDLDCTGR
jgi:hypothetical protein